LVPGVVTVLPGGRHASLRDNCVGVASVDGRRLTADTVLLDAAEQYGPGAMAVVLTGKLADGAVGVRAVKRSGGIVLVEDPSECSAAGMPSAALSTGCVDHRLPLRLIGPALVALTMAPGAADLLRVSMPAWASFEPSAGRSA
jgi:two-component system, chemotaxis family, protein-glutamate methylesterase/glutaminase